MEKEAFERARSAYDTGAYDDATLEFVFPQLKESEDERIINQLITLVDSTGEVLLIPTNKEELIAYLEKQKEKGSNITANLLENGITGIQRELIEFLANNIDNSWVDITKSADAYAQRIRSMVEKQKESLHISETCKENTDSFTDACKDVIVAIEKYLDWLTGYPDYAPKGKYSIRDMLYCLSLLEKQKEQKPKRERKKPKESWLSKAKYELAHKEELESKRQKELSEIRALKNTEQKPVDLSKMMVHKEPYIAPVPTPMVADEQKPAEWSECKIPKDIEKDAVQFCFDKGINITPYQAKQIATHYLMVGHNEGYVEGRKNAHIPAKELGLSSSMDYKQGWSEEDEEMLNSCISSIEEAKENRYAYKETDGDTSYDHEIAWLKSLRPSWKPSEEQMDALEEVIVLLTNLRRNTGDRKNLESLYEQLKKLM